MGYVTAKTGEKWCLALRDLFPLDAGMLRPGKLSVFKALKMSAFFWEPAGGSFNELPILSLCWHKSHW